MTNLYSIKDKRTKLFIGLALLRYLQRLFADLILMR